MRIMPRLGNRLPGSVVAMLGIGPGEKVVAWGTTSDATQSTVVAATDRALYVQAVGERLPWDTIAKATWSDPDLDLVITSPDGRPRSMRVRIDDSRDLPAAVHDRVTASVVVSERVDLGNGAKALLVARRSGDSGEIGWSVVFDAGLDPSDPALRAAADDALARLRDSLGI